MLACEHAVRSRANPLGVACRSRRDADSCAAAAAAKAAQAAKSGLTTRELALLAGNSTNKNEGISQERTRADNFVLRKIPTRRARTKTLFHQLSLEDG